MQNRNGNWIETYTGKEFYPLDPRPEEVDIKDIAHALSQICRFNGHTLFHYSVAQHCALCATLAYKQGRDSTLQLYALPHDAAEAYICDIPRPLKPEFEGYKHIEDFLQLTILKSLGLLPMDDAQKSIIKSIDDEVLSIEAVALLPSARWADWSVKNNLTIMQITPLGAEWLFLKEFGRLTAT